MKNTIRKGQIHVLVVKKGDIYRAYCREFGFIEEGDTFDAVFNRTLQSAKLLLKTVSKNPNLEPSLNVGLPIKYEILFYVLPLWAGIKSAFGTFEGDVRVATIPMRRVACA